MKEYTNCKLDFKGPIRQLHHLDENLGGGYDGIPLRLDVIKDLKQKIQGSDVIPYITVYLDDFGHIFLTFVNDEDFKYQSHGIFCGGYMVRPDKIQEKKKWLEEYNKLLSFNDDGELRIAEEVLDGDKKVGVYIRHDDKMKKHNTVTCEGCDFHVVANE